MRLRDEIGEEKQNQARTPRKAGWLLQIQRQPQRRPPKKKPAAATLRSRTAGSQDESHCSAIHNVKSKPKGAPARLPACGGQAYATDLVRLFQFFDERGDDFEEVAYDAVVGYFEDWRVLIFIDGGDGAGAFHADYVLDGAANAEREIEFGRDGLAGAADLAVHGEPAFVADGARGADFAPHQFREFLGERNIFRGFDAAAYRDQDRRLCEVHGLLGFTEQVERLGADLFWFQFHAYRFYGRCAAGMFGGEVGAECAGLEGSDPGGFAGEDDVGGGAALKHLTHEDEFSVFVAVGDAVADYAFLQRGRQLGREIADLIAVGEKNQVGFAEFDDLTQSQGEAVWRVFFQELVFDGEDFIELVGREVGGQRPDAFADYDARQRALGLLDDLLGGGQSFEADLVPLRVALFGDEQDFHFSSVFKECKEKADPS